jgi:putative flippase GtrA
MARSSAVALARVRFGKALRRPHNWMQLAKFSTVGAAGYVVNLSVYTALLLGAGVDYRLAATCSFLVAVTNNYTWNRLWTFRGQRGHVAYQGMRFLVVSVLAYLGNLVWLTALVWLGAHKVLAQAVAIILVTPFNFAGNKLWSFRVRPISAHHRRPRAPAEEPWVPPR